MTNPAVRLLICDDHLVVRAGLRALLDSAPDIDVIGEAGSGAEVVTLAAALHPDVVLMDLQLGGDFDGVEATRRITALPEPRPHVLVLTTFDTDADITRAIAAGATGYLLKAEPPEELFAAIHTAAAGRTALSAPVAGRVMARMRDPRPGLTTRETDILAQLAHGLGNREIAKALHISEATVKTHLGRIYAKLGVDTRAAAVAVAKEQRLLG
ncbi:response regulator [Nocardia cyriacigeorgica]|uniref:Response regulator protein vraR n=1 Tax=Nocardia cyriacigeorgica TaxID=135487 RepID=A0A2L2JXI6_9NOCA|nr:response regulator transcription factor [Nocardia cyriacigeorgica]AVH24563.1 DNA-binding response regulator [Nocardia cyriacigeorgica]MBF6318038.1 response regulator transcription factor [Nocardia cyriacigeorgica]MBF6323435.1 response regulator transcription factor [Nocardia cyriacigeorgica]MBF6346530.1 response regulator transcription factor [Nocardia cyriacigeorgica]MBF6414523.1 response regulator transcription factor [Nocardia cyriacigeorgica]